MSLDNLGLAPSGLTILRAPGRRLAKLVRAEGIVEGFDRTRRFDLIASSAPDFGSLVRLLTRLSYEPECAVVRGGIESATRNRAVRRLLHADPRTGEAATLCEVARDWVALDMDGLPLPSSCCWQDLRGCGKVALAALPSGFQGASLVVVATAGHGFKPGARLRIWALLDRPVTGAELTRWLRGTPCDPAVFRPVQVIYTAAPVFAGLADPMPRRLVALPGRERVVCPSAATLAPPPRPPVVMQPVPGAAGSGRYAAAALARAVMAVASATVDTRHRTAVREAWGLARLAAAGLLTDRDVTRAIDGALQQAGKPAGEGSSIAAWALAQRSSSVGVGQ